MITKYINSGSFLAIMVCFLLPFLSIKCGDVKLVTFSGTQMAFGTDYNLDKSNPFKDAAESMDKTESNTESTTPENGESTENTESKKEKDGKHLKGSPIMIAILIIALLGVILSFLMKKGMNIAAMACAALILLSLIYVAISMKDSVGQEAGGKQMMDSFKIAVAYEIGYWLMLILCAGIIIYNIIDILNSNRKRDISPVI